MKEATEKRKIPYSALLSYTTQILEKLGYSREQAEVTARVLVEADARGVFSHGVARLSFYESNIRDGYTFTGAPIEIVRETPLSLVVDGHHGVGSCIAQFTMTRVVEKTRRIGAGFGAVRNSNHFGMAALWAEMATAKVSSGWPSATPASARSPHSAGSGFSAQIPSASQSPRRARPLSCWIWRQQPSHTERLKCMNAATNPFRSAGW